VFAYLQNAFNRVHEQLVLNADKTKLVFFTNSKSARSSQSVTTNVTTNKLNSKISGVLD